MSPENKALIERLDHVRIKSWGQTNATTLNTLLDAVRAEERARAVEVVRPFADYITQADPDEHWTDDSELGPFIGKSGLRVAIRYRDLRRAATYITDSEGGA